MESMLSAVEVNLMERNAAVVGINYRFINASTGNFTIKPFGTDKIDGVNSDRQYPPLVEV